MTTTDHARIDLNFALEVAARAVIRRAVNLDIDHLSESDEFAHIGETDWQTVLDRTRMIADTLDASFTPGDHAEARETLTARAQKEA